MAESAGEEKTSENKDSYKIQDLYDVNKEQELLKCFVDITLAPHDESWTKSKTKSPKLIIEYKYLAGGDKNDNLCTIRGETIKPNASVQKYYEFTEGGYDDVLNWEKECDPMCTEISVTSKLGTN